MFICNNNVPTCLVTSKRIWGAVFPQFSDEGCKIWTLKLSCSQNLTAFPLWEASSESGSKTAANFAPNAAEKWLDHHLKKTAKKRQENLELPLRGIREIRQTSGLSEINRCWYIKSRGTVLRFVGLGDPRCPFTDPLLALRHEKGGRLSTRLWQAKLD